MKQEILGLFYNPDMGPFSAVNFTSQFFNKVPNLNRDPETKQLPNFDLHASKIDIFIHEKVIFGCMQKHEKRPALLKGEIDH